MVHRGASLARLQGQLGQEKQAETLLKQIEQQVEAEKRFATSEELARPRGPVTLNMFAERWLKAASAAASVTS